MRRHHVTKLEGLPLQPFFFKNGVTEPIEAALHVDDGAVLVKHQRPAFPPQKLDHLSHCRGVPCNARRFAPTVGHNRHPKQEASAMAFRIGLLLFPDITQLDMTGPYEVFTKFPGAEVHLVWKSLEPITANGGMKIVPDTTFAACPQLDLVCVPGGAGMNALLNDSDTLTSCAGRPTARAT